MKSLAIRNISRCSFRQHLKRCVVSVCQFSTGRDNVELRFKNKNHQRSRQQSQTRQQKTEKKYTANISYQNVQSSRDPDGNQLFRSQSTLSKCSDIMTGFLKRRESLPPPSMDWIFSGQFDDFDRKQWQARIDLYKDIVSLTHAIDLSVKANRIQASSGRDIRDVTDILGNILLICSESPPKRLSLVDLPSTSQTCITVLSILERLNLDVQNIHNFLSIRAANQEHDWALSSRLFCKQIDPDVNGLVPVDSHLGWDGFLEMGLYGLAMDLTNRVHDGGDVVEGVLNAVRDMCIVSPTDEEKYMLAAGSALGRAGHWKGCVDYISRNKHSSELGQAFFAAMLNACYICEKYEVVLDVFYNLRHDFERGGGDWQWEGEYARYHPLCLDIILRTIGLALVDKDENQGFSKAATLLFHQITDDGGRISVEAIKGVLNACKNDADYEKALEILEKLETYDRGVCEWMAVDEEISSFLCENPVPMPSLRTKGVIDDEIIATVMDTCNAAGEYGMAILKLRMTNSTTRNISFSFDDSKDMSMVKSLMHWQPQIGQSEALLNSTITALSGLQCLQDAQELLSCAKDDEFYGPKILSNLDVIDTNILWNEAYRNIDRLLYAADCLKHGQHHISPEDKYNLSLAIALMLRCAIDSGQVNAGLEVARTIIPTFNRPGLPGTTVKEKMKSFFGFGEGDVEPDDDFWSLSDELYAAKLSAYRVKYGVDSALDIYFSSNDSTNSPKYSDKGWFKTVNLVLQMLIEKGDIEKAFSFFERMHPTDRGPDTYVAIVKAYKDLERFDKIGKVYMDAKKAALLSEKLCLCAMEAIVRGNHHGKIKILRSIVSDISEIKGVKPGKWIADHYWTIKRCLGFHYARLLMWWNDPNETKSMEYRLAIQHMEHRKKQNLQVETDALRCIIKLAEDQSLDVVQSSDVLHPPSRVFDSLIMLSTSQCHDKTQLLLEGLTYLLKTQSTLLGIEYLDYIKTNHISVDEKVSDLARSVANSQGDTTIIN